MGFGFEGQAQPSIAIDTDSGWPALSTGDFREHRRIPEFYEAQTIADSLNRSVAEIQQQITNYIMKQGKDAPLTLGVNLAPEFSEQQISIYRGAVYARSHADLLGYFSVNNSGTDKAESDPEQIKNFSAQSNRGVRLLLGLGRVGVHSL